jgi:putative oxidoreductase
MWNLIFPGFPDGRFGLALLLLRCFVGIAFIQHGLGKTHDIPGFMEEFGLPLPLALFGAWSQVGAGILLVAGLATPVAAGTLMGSMAVATAKLIGRGESFIDPHAHSWESSGFYLLASILILLLGPGVFSLDAWFARPKPQSATS